MLLAHAVAHANPSPTRFPTRNVTDIDGVRRNPLERDRADSFEKSKIVARPAGLEPAPPGLEGRFLATELHSSQSFARSHTRTTHASQEDGGGWPSLSVYRLEQAVDLESP